MPGRRGPAHRDPRRVSAGQAALTPKPARRTTPKPARQLTPKEASGKASPDKPSRERDASGDKPSDITPDAGASDTDSPPGAKLKAMGAVSLITLMRTGSAGNRGEALETGPAEGLVDDPENAAEADSGALLESAPGKADASHSPPEEIPGEQTGEDGDPRVAADEQPVDVDADPILAEGEAEQAQDDAADHDAGDDDTAAETDADAEADADAATQAATASAQNAATRNADPARGALPAQASDAARAALARAPRSRRSHGWLRGNRERSWRSGG